MENCQAYLDSSDLKKDRMRSQLIDSVAERISAEADGQTLPENMNKVRKADDGVPGALLN